MTKVRVGDLSAPMRKALGLEGRGDDEHVGVIIETISTSDAQHSKSRLERLEELMRGGLTGCAKTLSTTALIRAERESAFPVSDAT